MPIPNADDTPPMDENKPTTHKDGTRVYITAAADYSNRLVRFGANWDSVSSRFWVGVAKAKALQALLELPLGSPQDEPIPPPQPQPSSAKQLVAIAREHYNLGVTDTGDPFGSPTDTPHLAMMLRAGRTGLRGELARRYWEEEGTPASQQGLADALQVLEGLASQEDPARVDLRVAESAGGVYIDMGDPDGHVIEIRDGQWDITTRAPVLFRRTKLTAAFPKPTVGGDYTALWDFVPIPAEDRPQLLAWLVQTLIQSNTPHPVLGLITEHGAGKTSTTKCIVALTDPSSVPVRKAPRDADGWVTAANASWVVALDNLSGEVPLWLSDALCRAVTQDGDVRRALYTDLDVSVVSFRRAVIITGVDVQVTQGDLADRLLRIKLPRITEAERLSEEVFTARWLDAYPGIFGGLLDLAARVHHLLRDFDVADLPRMADFARVLAAVDSILETDGLAAYREESRRAAADTLESPFIEALQAANFQCEGAISADVLAAVTPVDDKWKAPKDWPKGARAVTGELTRHAPALRAQGWEIFNDDGRNKARKLKWFIRHPQTARNDDPPNPPDLFEGNNSSSDHVRGGGSTGGSGRPGGLAITGGGLTDPPGGLTKNRPADEFESLTSEDREAGQAGLDFGLSEDDGENTCAVCGSEDVFEGTDLCPNC